MNQLVTYDGKLGQRIEAVGPDGPLPFILSPGQSGAVVQTQFAELTVDSVFTTGQTIVQVNPIVTTTAGGFLEIYWSASCAGDTASNFYGAFLLLDGVPVQASRFTLDAASASFAFAFGGVKRVAVAPGAHSVIMQAQCQLANMTFSVTGPADNAALLVKEVRP